MEYNQAIAIQKILTYKEGLIRQTKSKKIDQPVFHSFLTALDTTGFIKLFNYKEWSQTVSYDLNDPAALRGQNVEELRKILTYHIRTERFVRNHLATLLKNGYFTVFLEELEKAH